MSSTNGKRNAVTRRGFLKGLGVAGVGITATAASAIHNGKASAATISTSDEELVTVLDISKCVACGACVEACRETNGHKYPEPAKPFPKMYPPRVKVEDWSDKRDVDDRLTPYNWLYIQTAFVRHDGEEFEINIPRRCLHCTNPPCANLCPWGAARKEDNGIVQIDQDLCLGGAKCRVACPWHIPQRQTGAGLYLKLLPSFAGNGIMNKCDRCYDRVAVGKQPACIEACPMDVQVIGPRSEMIEYAKNLAKEMDGFIYGLEENGGTNTFYVSPVPFEKINAAIEKGKGKPHFDAVDNTMQREESLTTALVAAPVAGIFAGILKMAAFSRKETRNDK